tara:strand:- start:868 stop:1290 length:423 start_codon:yes stop_codon:yes gene_type:complete
MAWVYDSFGFRKWVPDEGGSRGAIMPQAETFMEGQKEYASVAGDYGSRQKPYTKSLAPQKKALFGGEFAEALAASTGDEFGEDVPKGTPTFAGGSPLKGQYAKPRPMAPWAGAQAPSGYGMVQPKKKIFEGYKPWSLMGY